MKSKFSNDKVKSYFLSQNKNGSTYHISAKKSKHFEQYFNNQPDENLQASPVNDRRMLNK